MMEDYNDIGIPSNLDGKRIRKLLRIGIFAAVMVLVGDMLLGYGVHDLSKEGLEGFLSAYLSVSDPRIFWSALLGLIGIPLETLCWFGIYRLIVPYSKHYAHILRSGIFGCMTFGACGVHVPCLAAVYVYKHLYEVSPERALETTFHFGLYFLLPAMVLFFLFWSVFSYGEIMAIAKGYSPLPKKYWIFSLPIGQGLVMLLKLLPETALRNALTAGWISLGNIWMLLGLLIAGKKAGLYE